MDPFVLKIAIFPTFLYLAINIFLAESLPLRQQRSTYVDWTNYNSLEPQGFGTYSFGYDIEDPEKDNIQFRDEERFPNGTVKGSYGYLRPDGIVHMVHYTADKNGYRATVEEYPRGQLKPLGNQQPFSSTLLAAVQSKDVYKKQRVHEQRQRPVDTYDPQYTTSNFVTRPNINGIDNGKRVPNLKSSSGVRNPYIFPNRFYS